MGGESTGGGPPGLDLDVRIQRQERANAESPQEGYGLLRASAATIYGTT